LIKDPEVVKAAHTIVNANRRTRVGELDQASVAKLRLARTIVRRAEDRRIRQTF